MGDRETRRGCADGLGHGVPVGLRSPPPEDPGRVEGPNQGAEWLVEVMSRACRASMPYTKLRPNRAAYWWSDEIAQARRLAIKAGRLAARRGATTGAKEGYRAARLSLRVAIKAAKARAYEELLVTVEENPWGRPYKMVLNRLRPRAPPLTESLDPRFLEGVLHNLFPPSDGRVATPPDPPGQSPDWEESLEVGAEELREAVARGFRGNTAPGPDGLHKKIWALAWRILAEKMRHIYTECLRLGRFPPAWRRAKLVLLRKEGRKADDPSAFRPICLLDEVGKVLERIVLSRLVRHLSRVGPNISNTQFGFREARSTVDAVKHVRGLSDAALSRGRVLVAVSLDITNAFNSLPWEVIKGSLARGGVPVYLRRVVGDYLRDRLAEYVGQGGSVRAFEIYRGVPQGSVLGPFLWNVGYDAVLRTALPLGCSVVGYADDTLLLVEGESWGMALRRAEVAVSRLLSSIRGIGLEVAEAKTEATVFYDPKASGHPPPNMSLAVGAARVEIGPEITYLGLILDGRWTFRSHIKQAARRARERAAMLGRLLPNLGGPSRTVRRLYAGTVRAVALYGAPVFADRLIADRRSRDEMRSALRLMAARVARAYRTVSRAVLELLAGAPPPDLLADEYSRCYEYVRSLRERDAPVTARVRGHVRVQQRRLTLQKWRDELTSPTIPGRRTVAAILPVFDQWVRGTRGGLSFRATQVLTGHGCFGRYLCRIGREQGRDCHHCGDADDTAQHTLAECSAWDEQRAVLTAEVGHDLSLPAVFAAALATGRSWTAFIRFCEDVMSRKEADERERRGQRPRVRRMAAARGAPRGRAPADHRRGGGVTSSPLPPTSTSLPHGGGTTPSVPPSQRTDRVLRPRPVTR